MKLPKRSDVLWIAVLAILFGKIRKEPGRKRDYPGPDSHKIPNRLSIAQLRELARAVEMAEPDVGAAIAMAESGGNVRAIGDHGNSIGLWQIHMPSCPKQWRNRDMLQTAGFNAQAAASMSNGGTNWDPWTTFRNGSYRKFLPKTGN